MRKKEWLILICLVGGLFFLLPIEAQTSKARRKTPKILPSPTSKPQPIYVSFKNKYFRFLPPDSQKIVFLSNVPNKKIDDLSDSPRDYSLSLIDADGSNLQYLSETIGAITFCCSPDGKKIAFVKKESALGARGRDGLYTMNTDGTDLCDLTNTPHFYSNLSWSPDGTKIACVLSTQNEAQIWIADAEGKFWYKLVNGSLPAWSPTSRQITFWAAGGLISVIDIDGKNQKTLNDKYAYSEWAAVQLWWSTDGKNIFCQSRSSGYSLYFISSDKPINRGNKITWIGTGLCQSSPSFDNRWVVCIIEGDVWRIDLSTRQSKNVSSPHQRFKLTQTKNVFEESPCFSRDGEKIVFARDNEIWIMNNDGSGQKQLTYERTKAIEAIRKKQEEDQKRQEEEIEDALKK